MAQTDFWESAWKENRTNWDVGGPTPALVTVLSEHAETLFPSSKLSWRVLIPGCGRAYDVVEFAKTPGVSCIGLELSETGFAEAVKYRDAIGVPRDKVDLLHHDFFKFVDPLECGFDVLFLCAIEPSLRNAWARKVAQLVRPGGILVAYMFPLREYDDDNSLTGPPFALSCRIYHQLLDALFECIAERGLLPHEFFKRESRALLGGQKISL
ncbi:hypothetical protein HDU82_006070, partial [Entophlyctis luteolus]